MAIELHLEETPKTPEAAQSCPECGHPWMDDASAHYFDCRYFVSTPEEEEAEFICHEGREAG